MEMLVFGVGSIVGGCGSRTPLGFEPAEGDAFRFGQGRDSGDLASAQCFIESQLVGEIPIDLYFMMDKSTSMNMVDRG
jgi:hypothetical protein